MFASMMKIVNAYDAVDVISRQHFQNLKYNLTTFQQNIAKTVVLYF